MRHSRHFLSLLCRTLGVCGMLAGIGVYLPLILPALFGLETFAITTASMEPQLPEGSLVFAGEIGDPTALEGRIPFWGRFAVLLGSIEGKIAVIAVLFISAVLYAIGVRIDR